MFKDKKVLLTVGTLALICVLSLLIMWVINKFGGIDLFVEKIKLISEKHYFIGILCFILLQILQVFISFVPGEPVEVMSGILYGTLGGLLICYIGIIIATIIVFKITRKYGVKLVKKILGDEFENFKLFKNTTKLEYIIFIVFLIPGTPKDALIYLAALTPISLKRFLVITLFARIPSIISSTFAGANISNGSYGISILIFVITAIIGTIGIYLHPKIVTMLEKYKKNWEK